MSKPLKEPEISPYWAQRAATFHARNPEVYKSLVKYAREAKDAGVTKIGIELLWNRMRWDKMVRIRRRDNSEFKLNQNYKAWYARKIMRDHRNLRGLFETRKRREPKVVR